MRHWNQTHLDLAQSRAIRGGFSVLEVVIASTLLSGILLATFTVMNAGSETVTRGENFAAVQGQALACLEQVLVSMPEARITAIASTGDSITYQTPIFVGDPEEDYDRDRDISWGSQSEPFGGTTTLRFVADERLIESTAAGIDYNRDGDLQDVFDRGHIERVDDLTGARTPISGGTFLQIANSYGADVDGDGEADPLFALVESATGQQLVAGVFSMRVDRVGHPYLLKAQSRVTLRNRS